MTQKAPNPVELYKGAVQRLLPILAGVKPEQLGDATPCSEWNVQQLMIHTIKAPYRIYGIITGGEYPDINAVDDPIPPEGASAAYEHGYANLLQEIEAPGALGRIVVHPRSGEIELGKLMMAPFTGALIHKWDLAKATKQDTSIDASLAEECYKHLFPEIERRRRQEMFGPEVAMPNSSSIQDRLLAMTGRQL